MKGHQLHVGGGVGLSHPPIVVLSTSEAPRDLIEPLHRKAQFVVVPPLVVLNAPLPSTSCIPLRSSSKQRSFMMFCLQNR